MHFCGVPKNAPTLEKNASKIECASCSVVAGPRGSFRRRSRKRAIRDAVRLPRDGSQDEFKDVGARDGGSSNVTKFGSGEVRHFLTAFRWKSSRA